MKKLFALLLLSVFMVFGSCKSDAKKEKDQKETTETPGQSEAILKDKPGPYNGWNRQILAYLKTDTIPESFPKYSGESKSAYKTKCAKWAEGHMELVKDSKKQEVKDILEK